MRASSWLVSGALLVVAVAPAAAQDVTFHGEVRPRFEYRDPVGTGKDDFTIMRVRAAMEARLNANLSVFVQMQDIRYWGEETNPSGDYTADHLDLHQGYLRYRSQAAPWLTATVGRQETALGEERLIGRSNWSSQGRAFDGVRVDALKGNTNTTFIAYKIGDETAPGISDNQDLFGIYSTTKDLGPGSLDVYWLHERGEGSLDTREHTTGARYVFTGAVDGRFEGALQRGRRTGEPVSAYMLTAYVGRGFAEGKAHVTLWYDYLSGDDTPDDGKVQVFNTLYGTNHKNYGLADLFKNIPVHTAGHGLQDRAVKLALKPASDFAVEADMHSFRTAKQGALSTGHYGNELDVTLTHQVSKGFSVMGGMARMFQDAALVEIGRLDRNMTWGFLMVDAIF